MTANVTSSAELEEHKANDILNIIGLVILITSFITILLWAFGFMGWIKLLQTEGVLILFWLIVKYFNTPTESSSDDAVESHSDREDGRQFAKPTSGKGHNQGGVLFYFFVFFGIYMLITITLTHGAISLLHRLNPNEFVSYLMNMAGLILNIGLAVTWFSFSFTFNKAEAAKIYQLVIDGDPLDCGKNLRPIPWIGICLISPFKGALEGKALDFSEQSEMIIQPIDKDAFGKDEDGQNVDIPPDTRVVKWYMTPVIDDTKKYMMAKDALARVPKILYAVLQSVLRQENITDVKGYTPEVKLRISNKIFGLLIEPMREIGLRPLNFILENVERTRREQAAQASASVNTIQEGNYKSIVADLMKIPGMTLEKAMTAAGAIADEVTTESTTINSGGGKGRKRRQRELEEAASRAELFEAVGHEDHQAHGGHKPGDGGN